MQMVGVPITRTRQLTPDALNRRNNIMERRKKINTPFLLLALLFVLTQSAYALSATVSYDSVAGNVQGNNTKEEILSTNQSIYTTNNQETQTAIQTASITDPSATLSSASDNANSFNIDPIPASAPAIDPAETEIIIDPGLNKIIPASMHVFESLPDPVDRYVNADKLNVREKPTKDSTLITSLKRGDKVSYYKTEGDWARIATSSGQDGYVLAGYLVDSASKTIKPVVKYVNADKLNVRSEPTKDSKLVTSITRGDKVSYYETVGEWARITTWTDKNGYVLAKYLVSSSDKVEWPSASRSTTSTSAAAQPQSAAGKALADQIVEYAKSFLGVPYVWGGHSPKGFDCSGFTYYVFAHFGIKLPTSSYSYYSVGTKVSRSELQKGDILLWDIDKNGTVGHVGIYIGDGMFIHASSSKRKVVIRSLASYGEKYLGARRVIK